MPEDEKEPRSTGTRIIALSACGTILSYGLCRIGVYQDRNIHDGAPGTFDTLGGLGFLLCAIALAIGVLVTTLEAVQSQHRKRPR